MFANRAGPMPDRFANSLFMMSCEFFRFFHIAPMSACIFGAFMAWSISAGVKPATLLAGRITSAALVSFPTAPPARVVGSMNMTPAKSRAPVPYLNQLECSRCFSMNWLPTAGIPACFRNSCCWSGASWSNPGGRYASGGL